MRSMQTHFRRVVSVILCVLLLVQPACTPPPTGGSGDPIDNVNTDHITPPPLSDDSAKAFAVMVTPDRRSGAPGTRFVISAEAIGNDADIQSFAWSVDGDEPSADTAEVAFTIDEPGEHAIEVTLRDSMDQEVSAGVILRVFDTASSPPPRTASINPSAGFPGTFVRIESPALNNPAALAEVSVNGGDPFEPYRPELGVANFLIPLDAAEGLAATTTVTVELRADGDQAEQFNFELSPLPALDDEPGTLLRGWLATAPQILESAESDLNAAVRGIATDVTEEELALLRALLRLARARFMQMDETITPRLDEFDAETLTAIDQALIANGATARMLDDLTNLAKATALAKNANDLLIDRLCRFHDVIKALIAITDAIQNTAMVVQILSLRSILIAVAAGNPVAIKVGLEVLGVAGGLLNAGVIGDVLKQLEALVPTVRDELQVTATPGTLRDQTERTTIRIRALLDGPDDICNRTSDDIIRDLSQKAAERITQGAASAEQAFAMLGHTLDGGAAPGTSPSDALAQVRSYLADVINAITSAAVSNFGLDALLSQIREKLCSQVTGAGLLLQPDPDVLTQIPEGSGIFSGLEEESVQFACNRDVSRTVTFRAERTCGSRMLSGEGRVTCGSELCTENALSSLTTTMTVLQSAPQNNFCKNLSEVLQRDIFEVFITNNHPSRTIAIATATIAESDKQQLPRGCSEDPGNFSSPEECSERIAAGCDTPPGLFLEPGETSVFGVLVNCFQVLYPQGGGTCGDLEIETIREHVIVQAVYCDDFETAQQNFCARAHPQLTLLGLPAPEFGSTEIHPCP